MILQTLINNTVGPISGNCLDHNNTIASLFNLNFEKENHLVLHLFKNLAMLAIVSEVR